MIASVWYPTNYFRLSFGKQDRLSQIALSLKQKQTLPQDAEHRVIVKAALAEIASSSPIARQIASLGRYVPYRFLRPFFSQQLRGVSDWKVNKLIAQFAKRSFEGSQEPCFYQIVGDDNNIVEIHPIWFDYLQTHLTIVTGFCLWHLLNYLQNSNPNVPNIAGKLLEPEQRSLRQGRKFWRLALDRLEGIQCIYSGNRIRKSAFSLDHFLPWSFVTHDLLWNMIPTIKNVNSAKGDRLPDLSVYFEPFARLQYEAFQVLASTRQQKLLEDYVLLFKKKSTSEVKALPYVDFRDVLQETIGPQAQIAQNMGFIADWTYLIEDFSNDSN